jgi:hypothetical protein
MTVTIPCIHYHWLGVALLGFLPFHFRLRMACHPTAELACYSSLAPGNSLLAPWSLFLLFPPCWSRRARAAPMGTPTCSRPVILGAALAVAPLAHRPYINAPRPMLTLRFPSSVVAVTDTGRTWFRPFGPFGPLPHSLPLALPCPHTASSPSCPSLLAPAPAVMSSP